jgi:hypothetical protein
MLRVEAITSAAGTPFPVTSPTMITIRPSASSMKSSSDLARRTVIREYLPAVDLGRPPGVVLFGLYPCGGASDDESTFDGLRFRCPGELDGGWNTPRRDETFRFTIGEIRYQ